MDPKTRALKFIKYALDAIEELRHLNPDGVNTLKTHSGKLAYPGIKGDEFESVLEKIRSKEIAVFHENRAHPARGWGSTSLTITILNWDNFDKYYKEVKLEFNQHIEKDKVGSLPGVFIAANKIINRGEISSEGPEAKTEIITEDYEGSGVVKSKITQNKSAKSWLMEHLKEIIIGIIIVVLGGLILNWIL